MPLIWCGSLSSQFNSLLMQKMELGPILGFWQPWNLQRFVGFFFMGVGESIMHISDQF
jgi:hypothetical protein